MNDAPSVPCVWHDGHWFMRCVVNNSRDEQEVAEIAFTDDDIAELLLQQTTQGLGEPT